MPKGVWKRTDKHLKKLRENLVKANDSVRGKPKTDEHKKKLGDVQSGKKSIHWKGKDADYCTKHMWLYNRYGTAKKCENLDCEFTDSKRFEWANISGEYKREREDYAQLCSKCHRNWDCGNLEINLINKEDE